ncbi:MAG: ABC transporter permease, partial [Planctomycetaceae bacterium]|nr:ABC transporter permease [Planctomycetaceae bacterium]
MNGSSFDDLKKPGLTTPDDYAQLLTEASAIQGVSLWQDAWRRLRRKRIAMLSLGFLVVLVILALLTPLLPLQSPIRQDAQDRKFQSPNWQAVSLRGQRHHRQLEELQTTHATATGKARDEIAEQIGYLESRDYQINVLWH